MPDHNWGKIITSRVLTSFLQLVARLPKWDKIYLVSPWMSEIHDPNVMNLNQIAVRLRREDATVYIVTRPPQQAWHEDAIATLASTGRARIGFEDRLHTKLYCARTAETNIAMFGSANFTQQSLSNRELGILAFSYGAGRQIVKDLEYEAATIYRHSAKIARPGNRIFE